MSKNLIFILGPEGEGDAGVARQIANMMGKAKSAHFTNGTYSFDPISTATKEIRAFEYVTDQVNEKQPLVLVVNSDVSMESMGRSGFESESTRAGKIAGPLAEKFPERSVIVAFIDETTPETFYQTLHKAGVTGTLHKWGYGVGNDPREIIGRGYFNTYAFPLPGKLKATCHDDTPLISEVYSSSSVRIVTTVGSKALADHGRFLLRNFNGGSSADKRFDLCTL